MAQYRSGPNILKHSRIQREADEWGRKRAEEDRLTPLDNTCRCGRRSVRGPTYMRQPSCQICHRFIKGGKH